MYKSVHYIVAINIDEHYTNHRKRIITAIKTNSIYITHPTARKNCHRYSFMPRTVAEWNRQPASIRKAQFVDTFRARLCSIKLSTHSSRYKIS